MPAVTKLRFHPKPVESIFHDDDMSFCFIDADKNLYIYDVWRQTKVFIRNIAPLQERYGHIVGVAPFYEDFVIAFRTNGLVRLNVDDAGLHRLDLPSGPQVEEVHAFHEADDTTLYVAAARGGLHRLTLDRTGGRPRVTARSRYRFFHRRQELSTFFSMISEGDSVLWLGSREQGLVRFSTATCSYDVYSLRFDGRKVVEACYIGREDGLLNDMIHGIREDADGFLWISTNKGLIKYNPATVSSHTYYYSGGVQVGEFCDDAYYKCPYTGRLFFGGVDGLLYIDSGGAVDREYYPDILLRGMSFGRDPVDLSDFYVGGELRFEYTDEEIALRFAVPDYISGSGIEYSWMLEGCDKEWSRFEPSSEVFYRGLPVAATFSEYATARISSTPISRPSPYPYACCRCGTRRRRRAWHSPRSQRRCCSRPLIGTKRFVYFIRLA